MIQLGKVFLGKNINIGEVSKMETFKFTVPNYKELEKRMNNLDSKFVDAKQALIEEIQRQKSWSNS